MKQIVPKQEYIIKVKRETPLIHDENLPNAYYASRLLSMQQIKDMFGVSRMTIMRWIKLKESERIPNVKIRGILRFPLDKIMWWIEKHAR